MILALALVLAACAPAPRRVVFRADTAPIWSAAVVDPARLAGTWRQVAAFAAPGADRCPAGSLGLQPLVDGLRVAGTLCLDGTLVRLDGIAAARGPGRFGLPGQEDWWLLWIDSDYRTLAIGTPSGRFGFVLDRGDIPADRLTAAREVFAFNGYVAGALRPF